MQSCVLQFILPAQAGFVQTLVSLASPGQSCIPKEGGGLSHALVLCSVPSKSHVTEQEDQADQAPHAPSSAVTGCFNNSNNMGCHG